MYRVFRRRVDKIVGRVSVEEANGHIEVSGVSGLFMEQDLSKIWKTSRIGKFMFTSTDRYGFTLPSFFALDLRYILEHMLSLDRRLLISRRTARQIVDALNENTWLKDTLADDKHCLDFSKLSNLVPTPLDFQRRFLDYYDTLVPRYGLKGLILAGAPGSGKTITTIALAECLSSDTVIVVCPNNALDIVWKSTLSWVFKKPTSVWVSNSNTRYTGQRYAVLHYEYLEKFLLECSAARGKITIILDESHNANEMTSNRTQLFIQLCERTGSENIIWASGTSFKALGYESIPVFKTIDPRFNDEIINSFKKMFGKEAKKSLDILAHRIDIMSYKIEKSELGLNKPKITTVKVSTPDSKNYTLSKIKEDMQVFISERVAYYQKHRKENEQKYNDCLSAFTRSTVYSSNKREYDEYLKNVAIVAGTTAYDTVVEEMKACNQFENKTIMPTLPPDLKKVFKDVKSIIKYTPLKIRGECLGRVLGKKRMECIRSIAEHLDYETYIESTEKKSLFFTSYVDVLDKAKDVLLEKGYSPVVVYGDTNKELGNIIKEFGENKEINPLVATFQSLSTAVPLVMADVLVMINTPFRDYVFQQAISRVHRLGATTEVNIYLVLLDTGNEPNLSTRTVDILSWSQAQVTAIMKIDNPFPVDPSSYAMEDNAGSSENNEHDWMDPELFEVDSIAHPSLDLNKTKGVSGNPVSSVWDK